MNAWFSLGCSVSPLTASCWVGTDGALASVLSIYFDIKHASGIKNDSALEIGFLTGAHFALGNDWLTCHPSYFHI